MNRRLWLDMDGVLFDFIGHVKNTLKIDLEYGQYLDPEFYKVLGDLWWYNMPLQPWAEPLISMAKTFDEKTLRITTRLPKIGDSESLTGKVSTINNLLKKYRMDGDTNAVQHFERKWFPGKMLPGDLLLDDFKEECAAWETDGGKAIWFDVRAAIAEPVKYIDDLLPQIMRYLEIPKDV